MTTRRAFVAATSILAATSLARSPSAAEKDSALSYIQNDPERLKGFAWLLFNLDEFIYMR